MAKHELAPEVFEEVYRKQPFKVRLDGLPAAAWFALGDLRHRR